MTGWDGRGAPPSVRTRLAQGAERPAVSHLDVSQATTLASVGFHAVGEAIGYVVQEMSEPGPGACRASGSSGFVLATVTSGEHQRFAGFALYVDTLYRGYDLAVSRLLAEAVSLGADGVVGVRLEVRRLGFARQFSAVGTAVRAEGPVRPHSPFLTDLDAGQVTALLLGGWVPVSLAIGLSVSVRHEDSATARQRRRFNRVNGEIAAASDLVHRTRDDARERFGQRLRATGATHGIVSSMSLDVRDVGGGHRDMIAECRVFGTSVARFGPGSPSSLAVLPVRRGARARVTAAADDASARMVR
ncbi:MAG: hypothetical protein QOE76_3994 [Frankiales bacterium]|jgi:uncharacterized protein YbjQ (UPF0145 family)|nr:hypothetical protein [Frankiales bacterium]